MPPQDANPTPSFRGFGLKRQRSGLVPDSGHSRRDFHQAATVFGSTAYFIRHALNPPSSATASMPLALSSSAARALVASLFQVQ